MAIDNLKELVENLAQGGSFYYNVSRSGTLALIAQDAAVEQLESFGVSMLSTTPVESAIQNSKRAVVNVSSLMDALGSEAVYNEAMQNVQTHQRDLVRSSPRELLSKA